MISKKQAGAELGQTQVKVEVKDERELLEHFPPIFMGDN